MPGNRDRARHDHDGLFNVRITCNLGEIMTHPLPPNATTDLSMQSVALQQRFALRQSQTIVYDARAITTAITAALGPEPEPGTRHSTTWCVQRDKLFNHELDRLRAATGASWRQAVTFQPIDEMGLE
jgi:hypothetical protein